MPDPDEYFPKSDQQAEAYKYAEKDLAALLDVVFPCKCRALQEWR
jgi:hypothetical protein